MSDLMASSSPLFTLGLLPRHLFLISASVPGKMRADNCTSITRVWPWTGRPSTSTTHKHQLLMGYRSRLTQLDMSDNNDRLASQTKQLVIKAKICPTFKADCEPKLIWLFSSYYTVKLRTSKLTPHDRHTSGATAASSEFFQSLSNIPWLCSVEWESVSFLFSEQHQTFTSSSETLEHLSAHSWRMTQRSHQDTLLAVWRSEDSRILHFHP